MSLYTKSGDTGLASTITRQRVSKNSPIFNLLGTIDEATSYLGLAKQKLPNDIKIIVEKIQKDLSSVAGEIAGADHFATPEKVGQLEHAIDSIMSSLPNIKLFVIPGGTEAGAALDVARTVVRRAEREAVSLIQNGGVSRDLLAWLNRLSDMVYALARMADTVLFQQEQEKVVEASSAVGVIAPAPIVPKTGSFFERANALCRVAIEKARQDGLCAVVAVCDNGGNLVCLNRDDDSYIASIDVAINKAYTSMSLKMTTAQAGVLAQPGATLHGVQYTNQGRIVIFGGGVPLYANGKLVGALGVSGGSSEQDTAVAEYAASLF